MNDFVGLPYTKGSDTSKAAAESMVEPSKNQRQEVWEYIRRRGSLGATSDEVKIDLEFHHSSTTRLTELVRLGRIRRTEETRLTRSNRQAAVYVAIDPKDWVDQRAGWPCPKKPMKLNPGSLESQIEELQKEITELKWEMRTWKARAYRFRDMYYKEKL